MCAPGRISSAVLALFVLLTFGTQSAQTINSQVSSPRVRALHKQLQKGDPAAVARFWEDVRKAGTPLVESLPGDGRNRLVTFLWRGAQDTRNVVVFLQAGGLNPADNQMTQLAGSDVGYRSYVFPKDVRFLYKLSPNDDLTPLDALKAKGYEVTHTEFDGAHEYINWQGTLADGLIVLLGNRKR
jgi:Domain of unknown function (DUF3327)